MKTCLPLFVNGFLLVYVLNYPKQVIDKLLVECVLREGAQRDFSILFMPVFFMSLFVLALRPLITDLAKQWSEKRSREEGYAIRKNRRGRHSTEKVGNYRLWAGRLCQHASQPVLDAVWNELDA